MHPTMAGDPHAQPPGLGQAQWVHQLRRTRQSGPALPSAHRADPDWRMATTAVHAGTADDPVTGAVGTPIYQTSTFLLGEEQYRSIEEGYARDRFIYTRYGNPSQWAVQDKLAALEGGESALVFSSGMAAIAATVLSQLDKGGHIVASNELYGGTYNFFQFELPAMGYSVSYVDPRDLAAIEAAIQPNTMLLYFETMSNPLLKVVNVPALGDIARRRRLRLVVDATFSTPTALRPLEHGAHLVVHSCTKYLGGHSDLVAGVAVGSRKVMDPIWPRLLSLGGCLDPHACFMLERSLKTLPLRMRAHAEGALALAQYLQSHPRVSEVLHPGLPSHPDYALAQSLLRHGGGMVSFAVGSDAAALELLRHLRLMRQATSLGGVETLVSLPFNTSHAAYTVAQRTRLGIAPGCVRLSVGVEDPRDLIDDLRQALEKM